MKDKEEIVCDRFKQLTKALNDKYCPEFVMVHPFIIINTRNITKILFDVELNNKETVNDPYIDIFSDSEETRIRHVNISVLLEAIEKTKKELA